MLKSTIAKFTFCSSVLISVIGVAHAGTEYDLQRQKSLMSDPLATYVGGSRFKIDADSELLVTIVRDRHGKENILISKSVKGQIVDGLLPSSGDRVLTYSFDAETQVLSYEIIQNVAKEGSLAITMTVAVGTSAEMAVVFKSQRAAPIFDIAGLKEQ